MNAEKRLPFYIRVTNVEVFNMIVADVEKRNAEDEVLTHRREGYYELRTDNESLWRDLSIYGQMIAQAQDEFIEAGEDPADDRPVLY